MEFLLFCVTHCRIVLSGFQRHADLSCLLQEGFAPPEDDEIDKGAQGDQNEF